MQAGGFLRARDPVEAVLASMSLQWPLLNCFLQCSSSPVRTCEHKRDSISVQKSPSWWKIEFWSHMNVRMFFKNSAKQRGLQWETPESKDQFSTRTRRQSRMLPLTLIQNSYHSAQPGCAPGFALLRAGGFAISIIAFLGRQSGESLV